MNQPQERRTVADEIRIGLEQCIQHAKGEIHLKTTSISSDDAPDWVNRLAKLREQHQLSQSELARLLNITPKTLKGWEERTSRPSRVAIRLIEVLQVTPEIVAQLVR